MYGGPSKFGARKRAKPNTLVNKVSRLQRQVALLKPEMKIFQSTGNFGNISTNQIQYLSAIAQGSDKINRIGDTIRLKYLYIKGDIEDWATTTKELFHLALVLDKDSNGVVPAVSGTAESIFTSGNATSSLVQFNTNDRYKLLWEFTMTDSALNNGYRGLPYWEAKIPLNYVGTFRDTSGAQTGAGKNALYFTVIVNTAALVADVNFAWEIKFTDV